MSATEDKSSTNTATTIPPIRVQSSVEGGGGGGGGGEKLSKHSSFPPRRLTSRCDFRLHQNQSFQDLKSS